MLGSQSSRMDGWFDLKLGVRLGGYTYDAVKDCGNVVLVTLFPVVQIGNCGHDWGVWNLEEKRRNLRNLRVVWGGLNDVRLKSVKCIYI